MGDCVTHRIIPVDPFDLVIFGATGDLARRKLLPGMYHRDADGQLLEGTRIIGCARSQLSAEEFRALAREAIADHVPPDHLEADVLERFLARLEYVSNNVSDASGWEALKTTLDAAPDQRVTHWGQYTQRIFEPGNRL